MGECKSRTVFRQRQADANVVRLGGGDVRLAPMRSVRRFHVAPTPLPAPEPRLVHSSGGPDNFYTGLHVDIIPGGASHAHAQPSWVGSLFLFCWLFLGWNVVFNLLDPTSLCPIEPRHGPIFTTKAVRCLIQIGPD